MSAKPAALCCFVLFFLAETATCFAQSVAFQPGEYLTRGGWGQLLVEADTRGQISFSISATGGNGHQCELAGEIRDRVALLAVEGKDEPCAVKFSPGSEGIAVAPQNLDVCHSFCGARASFEGFYFRPAKGCTTSEVTNRREEFKRLYDKKAYANAKATLHPLLHDCRRTLHQWDKAWIRNDLAITQYRLGDLASCRETLRPLTADARAPEAKLLEGFSPVDGDSYRPILKATRTNLRLCRAK